MQALHDHGVVSIRITDPDGNVLTFSPISVDSRPKNSNLELAQLSYQDIKELKKQGEIAEFFMLLHAKEPSETNNLQHFDNCQGLIDNLKLKFKSIISDSEDLTLSNVDRTKLEKLGE
jgi:hypothetical protein